MKSELENAGKDSIDQSEKNDAKTSDTESEVVTYVIVVHGMGEQRKNETVINVVNRFAEARRGSDKKDNRDVLSLGQASRQTGLSKVPKNKQPWMEFDGIPANPNARPPNIFLGKASSTGDNLRFVDLCWSDIMQDLMPKVVQSVDVWAKGLLGRLLRKHEGATQCKAEVPYWIRRVLFLLADTMLLLRFCMKFRFKEMEDLIFAKVLGDAQQYGEYARCRGRAVRRFHKMMARIEAVHREREEEREAEQGLNPREARYVIIAHSLGSIMSFDALLYAHAKRSIRRSGRGKWVFPGYRKVYGMGSNPDTNWVWRVKSFVTLGSPIDKYLMLWWLNYRYLLNHDQWFERTESKVQTCHCTGPVRKSPIDHFNYCDELDPVGHNLDVAKQTKAYRAVFKSREDIVFNRYTVPGAAHAQYWGDQGLFKWILARAVDRTKPPPSDPPEWFDHKAYRKLLSRIYNWVPRVVVASTFFALSFALLAETWQTVVTSAALFAVVVLLGRRLIDLSIWWRQIQRKESHEMWDDLRNNGCLVAKWLPCATEKRLQEVRQSMRKLARNRDKKATRARKWIQRTPLVWMAATTVVTWCWFELNDGRSWFIECRSSIEELLVCISGETGCFQQSRTFVQAFFQALFEGWIGKLLLVLAVTVLVVLAYSLFLVLPDAYRTRASSRDSYAAEWWTTLLAMVPVLSGAALALAHFVAVEWFSFLRSSEVIVRHFTFLLLLATTVYTYRWRRFKIVKKALKKALRDGKTDYNVYANHP